MDEENLLRRDSHRTEDDARADGFAGLQQLSAALDGIYPPAKRGGRKLYKVRLTYLGQSKP